MQLKRIGFIIPSSNRMVEQELAPAAGAGVAVHVARLRMTGPHARTIEQLVPAVADAARTLDDARCDAIVFHCTANSTSEGAGGERRLLDALRSATGAAVTTTATAIRDALEALRARRIVLVTPYDRAVTEHEAAFFEAAGVNVAGMLARSLAGSDAYCAEPPAAWAEALRSVARPDADAYVLSCANISSFPIIAQAEEALARPVVTSNQAVLWAALRAAGAPRPPQLGVLMRAG